MSKRIRLCKSLKEMKKIHRKYVFPSLKHRFKNGKVTYKKLTGLDLYFSWDIHYYVFEDELRSESFIKYAKKRRHLELIRQDAIKAIDDKLEGDYKGRHITFVGVDIAQDDYYWLYAYEDGGYTRFTCVGSVDAIFKYQ